MESIDDLLHRRIESTVKLLQLPLTDEEIARGVDKLASNIPDGLTGREIDYAYQLETSFTEWNESGVPDSILKDAVRLLLEDTEISKRGSGFNSDAYFGLLHGLLPEKTAIAGSLSLQTMRRVLSQSLFITSMFVDEEMSCSQVARVLTSTESKYIPSDASSKVASAFKLEPKISKVEAQQIIEFDRAAGEENFPDASLTDFYQI